MSNHEEPIKIEVGRITHDPLLSIESKKGPMQISKELLEVSVKQKGRPENIESKPIVKAEIVPSLKTIRVKASVQPEGTAKVISKGLPDTEILSELKKTAMKRSHEIANIVVETTEGTGLVLRGVQSATKATEITSKFLSKFTRFAQPIVKFTGIFDSVLRSISSVCSVVIAPLKIHEALSTKGQIDILSAKIKKGEAPKGQKHTIDSMLKARKAAELDRMKGIADDFIELIKDPKELNRKLTERGMLPETILNAEQLNKIKDEKPQTKEEMLTNIEKAMANKDIKLTNGEKALVEYARTLDTMSASVKNGLQAMSKAKIEAEKNYNKFEFKKTLILQPVLFLAGATSLAAAAVGALTMVGLTALTAPILAPITIAACVIGTGSLLLSKSSLIAGYIYGMTNKPEVTHENYFLFRSLRKTFRQIGATIDKTRFKKATIRKNRNELLIHAIEARLKNEKGLNSLPNSKVDPNLKKFLNKTRFSPEIKKLLKADTLTPKGKIALERKMKECLQKHPKLVAEENKQLIALRKSEGKVSVHTHRLAEAEINDLQKEMKQIFLIFKSKGNKYKNARENIPGLIESLARLEVAGGIGKGTQEILKTYAGINRDKLIKDIDTNYKQFEAQYKEALKLFFGGNAEKIAGI